MSRFVWATIVSLLVAIMGACSGPPSDIATPRETAPADVVPVPADAGFDVDADA